jgi:hypothetical protein
MNDPTLARIEAKIDRLIAGPESALVTTKEAIKLLGCRSYSSFFRLAKTLELKPITFGKYRRIDVLNAPARRALNLKNP